MKEAIRFESLWLCNTLSTLLEHAATAFMSHPVHLCSLSKDETVDGHSISLFYTIFILFVLTAVIPRLILHETPCSFLFKQIVAQSST